jgi:serine/threonine-protein kinase HipA
MKMAKITTLNILLYNKPIGKLTKLPDDQIIFTFDQSYINNPNRPTLSLSFKDQYGGLITDIPPARSQLPAFFSNLLPEGSLREFLITSMQLDENDEFALLSLLGQDLPGAITTTPVDHLNLSDLEPKEEHRKVYEGNILKFSLAGVQLKFSAVNATRGLTIPTQGIGGSWIVKLPSNRFPNIAENEFSMMRLASQIGINVPEIKIVPIENVEGLPKNLGTLKGVVFAIERFDRSGQELVHIEDFAQVFGVYPEKKYEKATYKDLAEVIYIEGGVRSLEEFIGDWFLIA